MPKGKKKGKKKSGKKEVKNNETENVAQNSDNDDIFEDREELLKEKLFKTVKDIENTKLEIETLKESNKTLEAECEKVRSITEAYTNYLNDREEQRKNKIVTLHDYHKSMIEFYEDARIKMLDEYEYKKNELQSLIEKKEIDIKNLEEEIHDYDEDLVKRDEQHKEIKEIENKIKNMRYQQAAELEKMKVHLITEHQRFQQESNDKINEIAREAYKEALDSLSKAFQSIELENRELRQEMLWTIRQNKLLNERKIQLLEENKILKEELQYAEDFASFRQIRQEKPKQLDEIKKK